MKSDKRFTILDGNLLEQDSVGGEQILKHSCIAAFTSL
jgi:hypothetical protein